LKKWCELPLLNNGTHIDKTLTRPLLSQPDYSEEQLNQLLSVLEKNKRNILEYAFYGTNPSIAPEFIIGVKYCKSQILGEADVRTTLIIYKLEDVISSLEKEVFFISDKKTVIKLGNSGLSLQRKGGDSGRKSSNQLQIKFIMSKLEIKEFSHKVIISL
jgi:hypothetical protein